VCNKHVRLCVQCICKFDDDDDLNVNDLSFYFNPGVYDLGLCRPGVCDW